jgi:hypothetical protein
MLKRKILGFGAILAVVGMLVGFTGCTQADVLALQGTLKNVDSVSGVVTVTLKNGTTQTFNFNDVSIDTIKQAIGSATLEVGDNVTVKIRQQHVEEVHSQNAEVDGTIKTVGADNVTITTEKHGDVTLKVNAQTKIVVGDNKTSTLANLVVGQQVEAKYDVSTMTAIRIASETDREGRGPLAQAEGIVRAVVGNTVTIGIGHGDNITVNVTSNTTIKIEDSRTGALADIKVGQQVHASYDKSTKNAVRIILQGNNENRQGRQDAKDQGQNIHGMNNSGRPQGGDNQGQQGKDKD